MSFALPYHDVIKQTLMQAAPALPPQIWWVTGMVFLILILCAAVDAYTAIIPDGFIFAGMLAITGMQGLYASWQIAAENLRTALLAGLLIWCVNQLWYKFFRHDALGMGDAKWTMLAVACFGTLPALGAWGIGACLAVLWIGATRLASYKVTQVTFGPFLLIGLCSSLYWFRFFQL